MVAPSAKQPDPNDGDAEELAIDLRLAGLDDSMFASLSELAESCKRFLQLRKSRTEFEPAFTQLIKALPNDWLIVENVALLIYAAHMSVKTAEEIDERKKKGG